MTGATGVHLVLWSDERQCWLVPASDGDHGLAAVGEDGELPLSVLRYVERTREPLVVSDATSDDRFAGDPYYSGADMCSLLGVPILTRGTLGAVLLLENRLVRGAFSRGRLESVKLIAGQLAVSLDNAQVNAEYRRIAEDQAALRRVAVLAARAVASGELFATVAEEVGTVLGADFTLLSRYGTDRDVECMGAWSAAGPAPFVGRRMSLGATTSARSCSNAARRRASTGCSTSTGRRATPRAQFGVRVAVGAPIAVADRLWGVMIAGATDEARLPPGTEDRLATFTELVATAIANAQSRAELEASRARLVTEADAARRRVVRDLHDGAQQRLIHSLITLGPGAAVARARRRRGAAAAGRGHGPHTAGERGAARTGPRHPARGPHARRAAGRGRCGRGASRPRRHGRSAARPAAGRDRGECLLHRGRGAHEHRQARPHRVRRGERVDRRRRRFE